MREIKFRAWDKKFKLMQRELPDQHELTLSGRINLLDHNCKIVRESEEFELMQFTGLKDRNGNPIYEGDILKIDSDIIAPVTFEDGSFQIISLREQGRSPLIQERAKRMVIAGNIYENPDLINQTNGT